MRFQDLLDLHDIPHGDVALCLHKPRDPVARRALAILVEERRDLLEAYQSTHSSGAEATVRARSYFASFLMQTPGEVVFIAAYRREVGRVLGEQDWLGDPLRREMLERVGGHIAPPEARAETRLGRTLFHLERIDAFVECEKRLVLRDPGGRNYIRLAETTPLDVIELRRSARLSPPVPEWSDLALTRAELEILPRDWATTLRNWRGVYLIVDETDGARYVGSAYGAENLLGRWRSHVAGEVGVTVALRRRSPARFRFSILELVSPTAQDVDVIACEASWKTRLDTLRFGLNEN
ncbi:GIY-YIG nuclease family protein [Ponticoccus alexandrii]|uniref:GIY-YIG nuclease family protein n=1 Tax=Ponticoccus alexandrii TaxID=1943633 RepID=A0ABX7FBG2_9RHOB|nr:GIY-YIG nuclease family protein [Ponticoccus alexandrii]QRF67896.1 GIY-YIG nuclease family protein [Ponticoccus alexandrii]